MTKIADALSNVTRLALDTVALIYFVEEHPDYIARVDQVFHRIDQGEMEAVTSILTLTEVLVQPIRKGDASLRERYRTLLLHSRHFRTLPIESAIAVRAADIRARYGLRTPDALQIATALESGCDAFLTNDLRLRRIVEIPVLLLDDLEA